MDFLKVVERAVSGEGFELLRGELQLIQIVSGEPETVAGLRCLRVSRMFLKETLVFLGGELVEMAVEEAVGVVVEVERRIRFLANSFTGSGSLSAYGWRQSEPKEEETQSEARPAKLRFSSLISSFVFPFISCS